MNDRHVQSLYKQLYVPTNMARQIFKLISKRFFKNERPINEKKLF